MSYLYLELICLLSLYKYLLLFRLNMSALSTYQDNAPVRGCSLGSDPRSLRCLSKSLPSYRIYIIVVGDRHAEGWHFLVALQQ